MTEKDFQRKITSYVDGVLGADERSEFEAFVSTHPEFQVQVELKQDEMNRLLSLIPQVRPSKETLQELHSDVKQSIFNLLKEEPQGFLEHLKTRYEDWVFNRSR